MKRFSLRKISIIKVYNMNVNKILFLSALDFKKKSIQVIRKTPEAFVSEGWDVSYLVARDTGKYGNYFYEDEINPKGLNVFRVTYPLVRIRNIIKNKLFRTIVNKITLWLVIIKLFNQARKLLKKNDYDVIYGYEIHGTLALGLLKLFKIAHNVKFVTRFQGSWLPLYIQNKKYLKLFLNIDAICALKIKANLVIMTDDGTQGNILFENFGKKNKKNYKFWANGVDKPKITSSDLEKYKKKYKKKNQVLLLSISRLEPWKRVDRCIEVINCLVNEHKITNVKYIMLGDGVEKKKLQELIKKYKLENYIEMKGSISNDKVKYYLNIADIFLSMYDLSNVGNPLLEAIRANKVIFTLKNGDTGKWVKHKKNGFIYEIKENLISTVSHDISNLIKNKKLKQEIKKQIKETELKKLWTWQQRLTSEVKEVEKLLKSK